MDVLFTSNKKEYSVSVEQVLSEYAEGRALAHHHGNQPDLSSIATQGQCQQHHQSTILSPRLCKAYDSMVIASIGSSFPFHYQVQLQLEADPCRQDSRTQEKLNEDKDVI